MNHYILIILTTIIVPYSQDKARSFIRESNDHSVLTILQESLEHEEFAVSIYRKLLEVVRDESVMLEEYARAQIGMEEQHALEIEKMLRDFS